MREKLAKYWKRKLMSLQLWLKVVFFGMLTNLVLVSLFEVVLIQLSDSAWTLLFNLSIAYVGGYIIYYLTTEAPKNNIDKKRIKIVQEELEYKINQINVRLSWFGLDIKSDKNDFETILKNQHYGKIVGRKNTGYNTLHQIKKITNELCEFGIPILIPTDKPKLLKEFKNALYRSAFMNPDLKYLKYDESQIVTDSIEIGSYLHGHITKLQSLNLILKSELNIKEKKK